MNAEPVVLVTHTPATSIKPLICFVYDPGGFGRIQVAWRSISVASMKGSKLRFLLSPCNRQPNSPMFLTYLSTCYPSTGHGKNLSKG
jgi:hypothetical protein